MTMTESDRIAVITGASSGIGKEVARSLAEQGFRILGIGRNSKRCAAAQVELREVGGHAAIEMLCADLSLMREAERVAEAIASLTDRVHVLMNNAGGMTSRLALTTEGLEENFASNHLGPFLLTEKLLPMLRRAAREATEGSVRIVNTASDASEYVPDLPWDDLQMLENYDAGRAYCHGKLANVMVARGLAKRLAADGIVAHAVHPGPVDTNFSSHAAESVQARMATLALRTPAQGADTLVWAATADEPGRVSGRYYFDRAERKPNPRVEDENAVDRLFRESECLVAAALASRR